MRCVVLALLAVVAGAANVDDVKNRPVSKVVTLLKDMITQLEKEAEEDEEVYEAMGCWCETNDKEKTKSIADAEQHIADLTSSIEELTSKSAQLNTQIEHLTKEVAKNSKALDQATALRTKQLAEFNGEEKDMLQSISALKSAVVVLGKQSSASAMLQDSKRPSTWLFC
jgi:predicted RNase H-like nuclease (RuvC/YqgF family)